MSETPTVIQALSAVMGDVQAVGKGNFNSHQKYKFRGVDAVVNAVGPALRRHGVVVVPVSTSYEVENYKTAKGSQMKGVTLTVSYRFYGPAGDFVEACATGESSDSGDKAMPKAHSVAYRTMLLQALCIPTDEPDPDSFSHERETSPDVTGLSKEDQAALWKAAKEKGLDLAGFKALVYSLSEKTSLAELTTVEALAVADAIHDWEPPTPETPEPDTKEEA